MSAVNRLPSFEFVAVVQRMFSFGPPPAGPRLAVCPGPAFRVRNYLRDALVLQYRGATTVLEADAPLDVEKVDAAVLRPGDVVLVPAGAVVPAAGEILEGCAAVDQAAITGESTPVVREAGDGLDCFRGTQVLSGQLLLRLTGA